MQKVAGVLIGGMVVLAVIFTIIGGGRERSDPDRDDNRGDRVETGVGDYVDEYGGSDAVYSEIARETDCAALQETFDRAADNNDRAEPGSNEHRWTLGYMTASEDRRQALDC